MLWLKSKTVYVPIRGVRTFAASLDDINYLRQLAAMGSNEVHNDLICDLLSTVRNAADDAKTPEELSAYRVAIRAIKAVLTIPESAKDKISRIENEKTASYDGGLR